MEAMAHSQEILNELMSISELVANLPVEHPYQVPATYFDNLPAAVMSRITATEELPSGFIATKHATPYKVPANYFDELSGNILKRIRLEEATADAEELNSLSSLLQQLKTTVPFTIPAGYFDKLAGNVLNRIQSEEAFARNEEEHILSPLLQQLRKVTPYKLPEGYFDELAGNILSRIKSEATSENEAPETLSPLLQQLKKSVPFKLPEGYFEEFPSDIVAGVHAVEYVNQELEAQAPVINDLKIKDPYQVPEGYFDSLDEKLLYAVKNRQKSRIISINFSTKAVKYSMAAVVAGIMSVAAWIFFQNKPGANGGETIADIQKVSNDEMRAYLDLTPDTPGDNIITALYTMKEDDVKELLTDLPDEELQQYLDQQAVTKDLIIN